MYCILFPGKKSTKNTNCRNEENRKTFFIIYRRMFMNKLNEFNSVGKRWQNIQESLFVQVHVRKKDK